MNIRFALAIYLIIFVSLVSADIFSINSGGDNSLIMNPQQFIEGFFSASTISLNECGTLSSSNSIYTLTRDVSSDSTCFTIAASGITLDCDNHRVNYSQVSTGYGLINNGNDDLTVRNCEFNLSRTDLLNSYGVYVLGNAQRNSFDNLTITTTSIVSAGNKNNHGIYFNDVDYSNITNSNISTLSEGYNGYNNHGIRLYSSQYNFIENNTILTNNYQGTGIAINSGYNNISHNNITTLFSNSYGMYFSNTGENNVIGNNIITYEDDAGGDSSFGIYIYSGTGNTFRNNSVVTYQAPSYFSVNSLSTDIDTSNLAEGKPVLYKDGLTNYAYENLNWSGYGQIVCAGCNNVTFKNITIRNDGILFGGTDNSFIYDSDIISNTSHGIYFYNADNNVVNNTNVSQTGTYVNTFKIRYSNYNNITNSYIYESANDYAIYLQESDYENFFDNTIDSTGGSYSIFFYGSTDYQNFTGNNIDGGSYCFLLDSMSSTESYFHNNDINCGNYIAYANRGSNQYLFYDNEYNGGKIYFGKSSSAHNFNLTNPSNFGGFLYGTETSNTGNVRWYLDVYVNNTFGNDVENATISSWNSDGGLEFNELTDPDGWIETQILREYFQNYTNKYYDGNYSLNATKFGYFNQSRFVNMTESKTEYFTLVGTPPAILIESPLSNDVYNYTTLQVDFNISVSDDENISSCWYSVEQQPNLTMIEFNSSYFWAEPSLGPGPQTVEFYCNDSSGNWGYNFTDFEILNEAAIAIDLSDNLSVAVLWNVVNLPVDDLDALGNNGAGATWYFVNISAVNTLVDLYVRADGDLFNDALDVLGLGNETYSFSSNDSRVGPGNSSSATMTTSYSLIGDALGDNSNVYLKFYLDAPLGQPAGLYTNNLEFKAVRDGQSPN